MLMLSKRMTTVQKQQCEYWLRLWTRLEKRITKDEKKFGILQLDYLIQYELETRRRVHVLDRLVGRRAKLMRKEEWKQVEFYLQHAADPQSPTNIYAQGVQHAGVQDRELSNQASDGGLRG